ncbi:MAG: DUF2442 domain-containing protein [Phormidesmis sp.]
MAESVFDEVLLTQQIERAKKAAAVANTTEPRATSAHYDADSGLIVVRLKSGATFSFPSQIAQGLTNATDEELAKIELTPSGDGLHWESLDADLHVPGLLAGVFGTKSWMARLQTQWQQAS